MAAHDSESGGEIPEDPAQPTGSVPEQPAAEPTPTRVLPSDYVIVADAEKVVPRNDRFAAGNRESTGSIRQVKPDSLNGTDYVVVAPGAAKPATPATPTGATSTVSMPAATPAATAPTAATPAAAAPTTPLPASGAHAAATAQPATEVIPERRETPAGASSAPQVVYVEKPLPPKKQNNRGFGVLITFVATILFAVVFALAILVIFRIITNQASLTFLANPGYWVPVIFFFVGLVIVVLVVNRGGWWAYIIGSLFVGIFAYVGSAAVVTLYAIYANSADTTIFDSLASPFAIAGAVLAREVALWAGVLIGRRGRTIKARNLEAREAFDREQEEAAPAR
jgi:hypothetical protein